jgi:hypothetical protein
VSTKEQALCKATALSAGPEAGAMLVRKPDDGYAQVFEAVDSSGSPVFDLHHNSRASVLFNDDKLHALVDGSRTARPVHVPGMDSTVPAHVDGRAIDNWEHVGDLKAFDKQAQRWDGQPLKTFLAFGRASDTKVYDSIDSARAAAASLSAERSSTIAPVRDGSRYVLRDVLVGHNAPTFKPAPFYRPGEHGEHAIQTTHDGVESLYSNGKELSLMATVPR